MRQVQYSRDARPAQVDDLAGMLNDYIDREKYLCLECPARPQRSECHLCPILSDELDRRFALELAPAHQGSKQGDDSGLQHNVVHELAIAEAL